MLDYLDDSKTAEIIEQALKEDIAEGDLTSKAIFKQNKIVTANLIAKQDLVLCGVYIFEQTFKLLDINFKCNLFYADGNEVLKNTIVAQVSGPVIALLAAERTALNFLQRMSGIATLSNQYVRIVNSTKTIILDTRKTAPGLRILDKYAVKTGGAQNHRIGLFDMVLIKENHISAAGGITSAVQKVIDKYDKNYKIEVEIKNKDELIEVLKLPVTRILLDNMSLEEMSEAVRITNGKIPLEASGNVNLERVKAIAETGVDFISIGGLTHSVKAADLSLIFLDNQ